jgi:TupA-like ATPgrasp
MLSKIIKRITPKIVKAAYYSSLGYKEKFGHFPNLINPSTFSEKIQKSKVFDRDARMPIRQDKVLVKDIVIQKLGAEYVIPTLWHGTELPPRSQRNWPMPYVIKANHGCGWNIFVRSEIECNWDEIEKKCENWMTQVYGRTYGEWLYGQIKPQLLVEPFISTVAALPVDYKFWVFSGKVALIQVISNRGTSAIAQAFYDKNWVRQPFTGTAIKGDASDLPPPNSMLKMVAAAEKLAEDFSFVRVDFYEVGNQPLFGEMTFYPASGFSPFEPIAYEKQVGAFWQ